MHSAGALRACQCITALVLTPTLYFFYYINMMANPLLLLFLFIPDSRAESDCHSSLYSGIARHDGQNRPFKHYPHREAGGPSRFECTTVRAQYQPPRVTSLRGRRQQRSQYEDPRSRECTPYVSRPPEIELHLKFHPKPKDPTRGFVFGTDDDKETEEKCDVVLSGNPDPDPQKKYGISRQHFCIDFNWKSGFLRLNNISRYGTGMRAPSIKNGQRMLKSNTMHMLHPAEQTRVQVGSLAFDLFFPERGIHQRQYELNWEAFAEDCGHAVPNLGGLGIEPQRDITRFLVRRESRYNTYLFHNEIGKGEFGSVCKASDHRTAELFAAKKFTTRKPR